MDTAAIKETMSSNRKGIALRRRYQSRMASASPTGLRIEASAEGREEPNLRSVRLVSMGLELMLRSTFWVLAESTVACVGEKRQVTRSGSPRQPISTVSENPPIGVREMCRLAACPERTLMVSWGMETANPAGAPATLTGWETEAP